MTEEYMNNGYENACCTQVAKQFAQVQLPVKIQPKAILGCPTMQCIGQPTTQCENTDNGYMVTISQCISICLPIEYSLCTKSLDAEICCKDICE